MTELDNPLGPVAFFSGGMDAALQRPARQIRVIDTATFATLQMEFTAGEITDGALVDTAGDASGISFPTLSIIHNVKSFKLTTGTIEVIFRT